MKPWHYKVSSLLLCALFLLTEGCTQKDLNEDAHTTIADKVQVIFDWSKAPDTQAQSMGLYLYHDEHDMMDYWFNNRNGDVIKSYGGRHTVVCHSNDDPYVHLLRNQHAHNEIEIYTANTAMLVGQGISTRGIPRAKGTEDEPLRFTPSMIYGTQDSDVTLHVSGLPQTLTLYPEELACHYSVEFLEVENLKNADLRIDATISSLAGGYFPGRMSPSSETVSHTFTLAADDKLGSLHSEFLTFGVPAGEKLPHLICLYIALKDKSGNFYTFDVSDQVNNAPDPRHVSIKIYGLTLPEIDPTPPPDVEGGISIEIDSWETFHFDLQV